MSIHYLKLVPEGWLLLFQPLVPGAARIAVVRPEMFPLLAHYETSIPTGPSAGRIYRRHEWLFVVGDDPLNSKFQLHIPHRILMVGGVPAPPAPEPEPLDELLAMAAALAPS